MKFHLFVAATLLAPALTAAQAPQNAPPSQAANAQIQAPQDEKAKQQAAERARAIARAFEQNARVLTLFDLAGKVVGTVGDRALYNQPVFSPDGTKIAVIKADPERETNDLWAVDVASGRAVQVTTTKPREGVSAPAWSPDAKQVAYISLRGSRYGIYRKAVDGQGQEELVYDHAGGPIVLTDWSLDGRTLSFYETDLTGSTLYLLPLEGNRQPVAAAKSEKQMVAARLSPDGRFLAYRSDESGRNEIWVRAVPPPGGNPAQADKWQVSTEGGEGMVWWRRDGQELYFIGRERKMMAASVKLGQGSFEFSRPRQLFTAPNSIPPTGNPGAFGSVSRVGERVVFAVPPPPPLRQLTVFDRSGKVVSRVGDPGMLMQPSVSPDGTKLAAMRQDLNTGQMDIWTFDLASGRGINVTSSELPENAPIWLPDSKRIGYVSMRGNYASIYARPWDGQGPEEQLFRYTSGAGMVLTDFSADGRFASVDGGGLILVVPLTGSDPLKREGVDFARSEFEAGAGRFSPDGRFVAFGSNETGRFEVYVRPFDAKTGEAAGETKWQISKDGAMGGIFWRRDAKELYFLAADTAAEQVKVMAVDVETTPAFTAGTPRVLFQLPAPLPGNPAQWKHVTPDGQRFVFAVPVPANATR